MTTSIQMTRAERRSTLTITFIYALRMLGLFIVLPVFSLETSHMPGGNNAVLVGVAMGIYGLTQGILQTPFGILSDEWGRKRTIAIGLVLFIAGSIACAFATTMTHLIIGRCLQGAGAISAATTALLSDQTRDVVRTKAMAVVGISIAVMFALSLVIAPVLTHWMGLSGLFWIVAILAGFALINLWIYVPKEDKKNRTADRAHWLDNLKLVLRDKTLLRLNLGVFTLHTVQLSMWMAIPTLLVQAGLPKDGQWKVYLPAVLIGFLVMGGGLFKLERKGYLRSVYLFSIVLMALAELGFMWVSCDMTPTIGILFTMLLLFFIAFNMLEAIQPSWVSRRAPSHARGVALGVYNSIQSIGLFVGGGLGGFLVGHYGPQALFGVAAAALIIWLLIAWPIDNHVAKPFNDVP